MAPSSPSKARLGWFFLTPSACSLRALEVPMTLSNKLRFYLRSSRKTEVRPQEVPTTQLSRRCGDSGKWKRTEFLKISPIPIHIHTSELPGNYEETQPPDWVFLLHPTVLPPITAPGSLLPWKHWGNEHPKSEGGIPPTVRGLRPGPRAAPLKHTTC